MQENETVKTVTASVFYPGQKIIGLRTSITQDSDFVHVLGDLLKLRDDWCRDQQYHRYAKFYIKVTLKVVEVGK